MTHDKAPELRALTDDALVSVYLMIARRIDNMMEQHSDATRLGDTCRKEFCMGAVTELRHVLIDVQSELNHRGKS